MRIAIIIYLVMFIALCVVLYLVHKNYQKNEAEFKDWQKKTDGIYDANDNWGF